MLLAAVWRPGTGEQRWSVGSPDSFKSDDTFAFKHALRISSITANGDQLGGVWRPGTGEQRWESGMSANDFKAADAQWFAKGLRITAVSGGLTAVWRPGTGEQRWETGMSHSDFKTEDAKWFDHGLRIAALTVNGGNFTAVWRPGTGEQRWSSGMSVGEFKAQDANWFNHGLRIASLSVDSGSFNAVNHRRHFGALGATASGIKVSSGGRELLSGIDSGTTLSLGGLAFLEQKTLQKLKPSPQTHRSAI